MYPIYDLDHVRKYRKALLGDLPPHIFAIANAAYTQMRNKHRNQVWSKKRDKKYIIMITIEELLRVGDKNSETLLLFVVKQLH